MSKYLIAICCLYFLGSGSESIYDFSVPALEGNTFAFARCRNKKILIVTLPVHQNAAADSMLYSLDSLKNAYGKSLIIVGVPSYEDGFIPTRRNELLQWYRSKLGKEVEITDGLYTRKSSGAQQNPLFEWLTNKDKNGHLDKDVIGVRQRFFVRTDGELYAVLGPRVPFGPVITRLLLENP
jgi:glutathione peroxidase